ncbi:hypothetical protein BO94DRAFT_535294 [Aspergillus sclerotioniger CBS 115572]|uniref:Extracellular membrane protein CFEM domain-containing protein n=1 Tax=Aspergillus sclerotioniger CBS 115572 TaxID=1450535 RepID=A0A317WLC6_9EURO|nr:hypothetical protein BO94DRAFT_535294 [Aspergillus sclerotioniger CBS 115572]PWY87193.1 hypothetical protein BO94DRAFT_535294 [Aspergillus sclerotioniger CBS 115572]
MKILIFAILSLVSITSAAVIPLLSSHYTQNCGYLAVSCAGRSSYDDFHNCIQRAMQSEGCGYSG